MANVNSIDAGADRLLPTPLFTAVSALEDGLLFAQQLGESFDLAGGEVAQAPWVFVYNRQIAALEALFAEVQKAAFAANWGATSQ